MEELHKPVLLSEVLAVLQPKSGESYLDLTAGYAGHASEILDVTRNYKDSVLVDRDINAVKYLQEKFKDKPLRITNSDFYSAVLQEIECGNAFDMILMDFGVSSPQLDRGERGFSFSKDGPLDMRMDQGQSLSAWEVVNQWDADQLSDIFYRYGDEKFARVIARAIERQRKQTAINTTWELVDVIKQALPQRELRKKGHPAKRVFQAIRIAVNDEMGELTKVLEDGLSLLKPGGRFCVISFHSLEDRIVKHTFVQVSSTPNIDKRIPVLAKDLPQAPYRIITKKAIVAGMEEQNQNHRAHSAKLRVLERI